VTAIHQMAPRSTTQCAKHYTDAGRHLNLPPLQAALGERWGAHVLNVPGLERCGPESVTLATQEGYGRQTDILLL